MGKSSSPTPSRYESVIDQQIRAARDRGELDNLPGTGQPIPGAGAPHDELWWVKGLIRREGMSTDPLLPTSVRLRKEIDNLDATLTEVRSEDEVRAVVADLNTRIAAWIRNPTPPPVRVGPVDLDAALARWHALRGADRPTRPVEPLAASPARRHGWRLGRRRPH